MDCWFRQSSTSKTDLIFHVVETGTQTFSVFEILDHTPVVRVRLVTIVCIKRQIAAAVVQNGNSSRKA
jgi:hypothetical protein